MMKRRKKREGYEDNFWLSATDMMAGILTIVLLMLMLFVLYLNQSKDEVFTPLDATEHPWVTEDDKHYEHESIPTEYDDDFGGSEHGRPTEAETEPPTEYHPQNGDDEEGYDKAAVFVTVVDADTGNTIKKSGVEFELYAEKNGIGGLQTLYTYYPIKTEYKKYETNDRGTFYLPEKITNGWYSLHNLVPPEGYYTDENTDFEIDDYWDWSEPYMVTVPMKPIKKTIRITAEDAETKDPVKDAVFKVIAAEDIEAVDGTVRYHSGDEMDEITTDKKGNAESKELYIGKYYIKQISAPEYYAVDGKAVAASVSSDSNPDSGLIKIDCHKTSVIVILTDERTQAPIEGAVYKMKGREELVTDNNGQFKISDLSKSTTYTLKNVSVPNGMIKKETKLSFSVDSDGLINESFFDVIEDTAYNLCLSVEVKDLLFDRTVLGVDLMLVDSDGEVVDEWTSGDKAHIITGLKETRYYVRRADGDDSEVSADIKDSSELQIVKMYMWDTIDLFSLLMTAGVIILAGLIIGLLINRRKKVNRANER